MLIKMPKGTLEVEVKSNCEMPGSIIDLYILLNALPSVFECVFEMIRNDNTSDQRNQIKDPYRRHCYLPGRGRRV